MKSNKLTFSFISFVFLTVFISGCKDDDAGAPPATGVYDVDGNKYSTITIGTQVWMVENLKTTKYRNGDPIPEITDQTEWSELSSGGYCNLENNSNHSVLYGKLYNWYVVNDSRQIAPLGWHVPSADEWSTLIEFLGGEHVAGGKMKESGIGHWCDPNTGATNESKFTALPGGVRTDLFFLPGCEWGTWWTATEFNEENAINRIIFNNETSINSVDNNKKFGMSVRCIQD